MTGRENYEFIPWSYGMSEGGGRKFAPIRCAGTVVGASSGGINFVPDSPPIVPQGAEIDALIERLRARVSTLVRVLTASEALDRIRDDNLAADTLARLRPAEPRPMTGLWTHLSPEQQAAALAYDGPENFGPAEPLTAGMRERVVEVLTQAADALDDCGADETVKQVRSLLTDLQAPAGREDSHAEG